MRKVCLVVCSVVALSVAVVASSIPTDPTGGTRRGTWYSVDPFHIEDSTIPAFDPFTASFCEQNQSFTFDNVRYEGPDCVFENNSDSTINTLDLAFTRQAGTITCFNTAAGGTALGDFCTPSAHDILFSRLGISNGEEENEFNILFAGHLENCKLVDTWSPSTSASGGINGTPAPPVPEPASAAIFLGGMGCLFGVMRWKRRAKRRPTP
jgi:hypothetical protein